MASQPDAVQNFLGINLRQDGVSLADQEVLRAVNADLHTKPGVIQLRPGRSLQNATNLGSAVRGLARHTPRRYQVAGSSVYRSWTSILTGLASNNLTTLVAARPVNDTTTWSFIADQSAMNKDNGTTVQRWGLVAPSTAPTLAVGAVGGLTGSYRARYTYARVVGSSVAHESNPCPAPTAVTLALQSLDIPVVASTDAQVTHIRIYRTQAGGTTYLFDQQVANTTATRTSSQADSALGTAMELDNDPPPLASWVVEFQGSLFLCVDPSFPHYLWYAKRFRPESFPAANFLEIGDPADPLQCATALTGLLGVFSRLTKYRVFGNTISGFTYLEALNSRGTPAPQAVVTTSQGALFVARDGLFLTNFVEVDVEISQAIQALFYGQTVNSLSPIDWAQTAAMSLAEYKRRFYFGYQDTLGTRMLAIYSLDTQHWYHYQHPVQSLLVEEDQNQLLMGDSSGQVWVLDAGTADGSDSIALAVDLPPRAGGNRFRRKGYEWLVIDAEAQTGTISAQCVIDGTVVMTASITGSRTKRFIRLPEETTGYTWQVKLSYTGTAAVAVYSAAILETDHSPGQVWVEPTGGASQYVALLPGNPQEVVVTRRRFDFAMLDAEAASGTWTLDHYIDGALAATTTVAGSELRRLKRLPAGLTGYHWYTRARYSGAGVPQLYRVELLAADSQDGQVWVMVPGSTTTLLSLLPAPQPLDRETRRRFQAVLFDAESGSGLWSVAVYIDDTLQTTLTFSGTRGHTLHLLPTVVVGSVWHLRATYSTTPVPNVIGGQVLDTGIMDGQLWVMDPATPQGILDLIPSGEGLDRFTRKRFDYLKFDAEASGGTWTLQLYIDDMLRHTLYALGNRARGLHRLPPGLLGTVWHARASYSTTPVPKVLDFQVLSTPLRPA